LSYTNSIFGWGAYPGAFYSAAQRLALAAGKVVKVAVIDTKIDRTHSDWVNAGGTSGDAAKGGQIDVADAKDFVSDPRQQAGGAAYHGTFVAGILAAAAGNANGIAGVGWLSQVMPITAVDGAGRANADLVADSIVYAWQKGARVINLSLGLTEDSQAVHDAIKAVTSGANPSLVVAAAGNCGTDPELCDDAFYPGSYPEVMSVSGTDATDRRAYCSDYNANVSVSAPADGVVGLKMGGGTMRGTCGTSAAAPQVSGLAAMLFSQNPARAPRDVRTIIESTVDDRGAPGRDAMFGFGRINVERALRYGQALPKTTAVNATIPKTRGGPSTITALTVSSKPITAAEFYVDHPGCNGAPGTAMKVADAGGGYKRLTATLDVGESFLAGAHPIWIRASDGTSWGAFAVGVLYVDRGKPFVTEGPMNDAVVRHAPGFDTATINYGIADDFSQSFMTLLRVVPAVSAVRNPPAVYEEWNNVARLGGNAFRWTPSAALAPGVYKISVAAVDEAYNPGGIIFEKQITIV
jgi:hypothetical protein